MLARILIGKDTQAERVAHVSVIVGGHIVSSLRSEGAPFDTLMMKAGIRAGRIVGVHPVTGYEIVNGEKINDDVVGATGCQHVSTDEFVLFWRGLNAVLKFRN